MITALDEYKELLYRIQDPNRNNVVRVPADEKIYTIDLNKRSIEVPDVITLEYEHNAETIYFSINRYYDNVDLSTMACVVQYRNEANPNKKGNGFIYPVPFFDLVTMQDDKRMIFPWAVQGPATAYPGTVTFSIKFYKISKQLAENEEGNIVETLVYDYILNTIPSQLKIQKSLDVTAESENFIIPADAVLYLQEQIEHLQRTNDLFWLVMDDEFDEDEPIVSDPDYIVDGVLDKNDRIYQNIIS